ncbi:MAG: hypothetical protein OEQ53_22090, partial [Saprospiraceae bacterium]|nr:hypothetical protein [Saprospiraceae bacterium]
NHEYMVKIREAKIAKIAEHIPSLQLEAGPEKGDLLILGWGSTFGAIQSVTQEMLNRGKLVAHAHLRYIKPFPRNLGDILSKFKQVLIPEINNGQLSRLIRDQFLVDVKQYNKIQGMPIAKAELEHDVIQLLENT